ncbi:MAG TPA: DUF4382 domain-containing protein [Thermodesulfobacteriota bacterium]
MKLRGCRIAAGVVLAALVAGCGGASGDDAGTFSLQIGDTPIDGTSRAVVTFDRVELVGEGGRLTVWQGFETVDLQRLGGCVLFDLVPPTTVPAGTYAEIRLGIVAQDDPRFRSTDELPHPSFVDLGGADVRLLSVPGGGQAEARIPGPFVVPDGGSLGVLADLDLRRSIRTVASGAGARYILRPVLRTVEDAQAAAIRGTVRKADGSAFSAAEAPVVYAWRGTGSLVDPTTDFVDAAKVVASAIPRPAGDPAEGEYCLGPLEPGTYRVTAVAGVETVAALDGALLDRWDGRYAPAEVDAPVTVGAAQTADGVSFTLSPLY